MDSRRFDIDVLRVICILFVIILHVCAAFWNIGDIDETGWTGLAVTMCSCRFVVPVFIALSGAVMLKSEKYRDWKYCIKKAGKCIVLYFAFSLLYSLSEVALYPYCRNMDYIKSSFIASHYHLYFLLILAGCYFVAPLFVAIINSGAKKYFYIIVLLSIIMSSIKKIAEILTIMDANNSIIAGINVISEKADTVFWFSSLGKMFPYLIVGYIFMNRKIKRKHLALLSILWPAATIVSFFIGYAMLDYSSNTVWFENYGPLTILLESVGVMSTGRLMADIIDAEFIKKNVTRMAVNILIVYLIHPFVLEVLMLLGVKVKQQQYSFIFVILFALAVMVISMIIATVSKYIFKKIKDGCRTSQSS